MDKAERPSERINLIALFLTVALAGAVGTVPWALVVGKPLLIVPPAVLAVVLCSFALRKTGLSSRHRPVFLEYLVGGVGLLIQPAAGSLFGLGTFVALQWLTHWANLLFVRLGWGWRVPETPLAFGVSLFVVAIMFFGLAPWIVNLIGQLHPRVAGAPSAFYDLVHGAQRRKLLWAVAGLGALLLLEIGLLIWSPSFASKPAWNTFLAMLLLLLASPVAELGQVVVSEGRGNKIDSVAELLRAAGYTVTPSPRTGREDLDPLLTLVDLYAESLEGRYAIAVRRPGSDREAILQAADNLATAAWALDENREEPAAAPPTQGLLVLVGKDKHGLADLVARRSDTQSVLIKDPAALESIRSEQDGEPLHELAANLLGLPVGTPLLTSQDSERVASG